MPTIGWFEILIVVAIAIIVLGPKDFPIMLKKVGSWIGTAKRYVSDIQNEVSNIDLEDEKNNKIKEENKDHLITIKSSMIGTFYRSASPEKPSFVNVGDEIDEGDTICIIEAMKLFNEIESEISGKIVKVLVDDATPVEFDQPLFLVDPS